MKTFIVAALVGCAVEATLDAAESAVATPPAKILNAVKEDDLTTVTLTPQAEKRLGIVTVAAELKKVPRTRLYGGDVVLPLGSAQTGFTNSGGQTPYPRLVPNPPASSMEALKLAEQQALADAEVQKTEAQLEIAKIAAERAEKLLRAETGSQRILDEARANLRFAQAAIESAQTRRALLGISMGQTTNPDSAWVRVAIYVGDLPALDAGKEARVGGLADRAGSPSKPARLAAGPPSADAAAATVDLYFAVDNQDHALRLGQRVGVTLALRSEEESLVVPWAGVLHDIHGGQWVYENTGPQAFARRRVQVARVLGADAVVTGSLKPGARIVTAGAAELFGTEFGAGK